VIVAAGSVRNKPIHSDDKEFDDLTTIKGIGPTRQQWLRKCLGVHTYQDLAALSVAEIETRLRAEGQVAARSVIEGWLMQAQELTAPAKPPVGGAAEIQAAGEVNAVVKADPALASVVTSSKTEESINGSPQEGEWKPFASFVVEFQVRRAANQAEEHRTTVHFMEADKTVHFVEADKRETWPGLETARLCQWMFDQVVKKEPPQPVVAYSSELKAAITPPPTAKVSQVRAFQPPQTLTPVGLSRAGQSFSGMVRGNEPFALELSFDLTGTMVANLAQKHTTYRAEFHVRNLATRATTPLGGTQPESLNETKLAYTALLPHATLPPGVYCLQALVTFQGAAAGPGYLEIPLLRVV
jgi:hypothetical protein